MDIFHFFTFFFVLITASVRGSTPHAETSYLHKLFLSTNGHNWIYPNDNRQVWNFTQNENGEYLSDPCDDNWAGVFCRLCVDVNPECHITTLSLGNMNLQGSLPQNISVLMLETLTLRDNHIVGQLPDDIFDITSLQSFNAESNSLHGSISSEIGNLRNLSSLALDVNQFTGSIPNEFGDLMQLTFLILSDNLFTHTIPHTFSQLSDMRYLWLDANLLTGTIPPFLGNLTNLVDLVLYFNDFTGTLPDSLLQLSNAEYILFNENRLTGTISDGFGTLTNMTIFWPSVNWFTGTISESFGNLVKMDTFIFNNNDFHGPLPNSIAQLTNVYYFAASYNTLTGTIPEGLVNLTELVHLELDDNLFTGTISNNLNNLNKLVILGLSHNKLSKTIPASVGTMTNLMHIALQSNLLTGTMPPIFITALERLFVQSNRLSGTMTNFVWNPNSSNLMHIDISSNLFSGQVPNEVFTLPNITNIAMSENCFSGSLPRDICTSSSVEVMSMDGLGTAKNCPKNDNVFFFTDVVLFNTMDGSLPGCLWSLPNLRTLHLAGNGFSGTISETISDSLVDISLSHNYIDGSIPIILQTRCDISVFDVSYNRITGEYRHSNYTLSDSIMSMEVNRLSGPLHGSDFAASMLVKVLHGNIFECAHLPRNDDYYDLYVCGSREFDIAFYGWLSLLLAVVLLTLWIKYFDVFGLLKRSNNSNDTVADTKPLSFSYDFYQNKVWDKLSAMVQNYSFFVSYLSELKDTSDSEEIERLRDFSDNIRTVCKHVMLLAIMGIILTMPILVLKLLDNDDGNENYITHTNTYSWLYTLAYLSGNLPVVLLMAAWTIMALFLVWILYHVESTYIANHMKYVNQSSSRRRESQDICSTLTDNPLIDRDSRMRTSTVNSHIKGVGIFEGKGWKMLGPMFINIVFLVIINVLYIRRLSDGANATSLLFIQLFFALFKVVYNNFVVPYLCKPITDIKRSIWVRTRIYVFNSIWVPALVTIRSSDACLKGIWTPRDDLYSEYSYSECVTRLFTDDGMTCTAYQDVTVELKPLTPPFLYNYQCASTLLTSYLPVLMYMYMFHLALPFCFFLLSLFKFESFRWEFVKIKLPGIWWPNYWLKSNADMLSFDDEELAKSKSKGIPTPRKLINSKTIITQITHHICILLTFGMCSPQLALAVICAIVVTSKLLQYMIGRFTHFRLNSLEQERRMVMTGSGPANIHLNLVKTDYALCALSEQLTETLILVKTCFFPVLTTSALFMCLICFEMSGDVNGWRKSLWIPITFACLYVAIIVGRRILRMSIHLSTRRNNPAMFVDSGNDGFKLFRKNSLLGNFEMKSEPPQ